MSMSAGEVISPSVMPKLVSPAGYAGISSTEAPDMRPQHDPCRGVSVSAWRAALDAITSHGLESPAAECTISLSLGPPFHPFTAAAGGYGVE